MHRCRLVAVLSPQLPLPPVEVVVVLRPPRRRRKRSQRKSLTTTWAWVSSTRCVYLLYFSSSIIYVKFKHPHDENMTYLMGAHVVNPYKLQT